MRAGPDAATLAAAASWGSKVSSWLGGRLLADRVPLLSGRWTTSVTSNVPDKIKFDCARYVVQDGRTVDLLPLQADAALARYGQQLSVTLEVAGVDTRIGRFQIDDWDWDEDTISVTAFGLLKIASDSRLLQPTAPRTGGTLKSEFLRLLPNGMSAEFHPALVDRPVPATMTWDEDRLGALYDIADAWPAVLRMDEWGQVRVLPPPTPVSAPVAALKDGVGGTVVRVPRKDTRQGAANIMVVRSSADGVNAWAQAQVTSGPMAVATYNPVPVFYSSPLLRTQAECLAVAQARLPQIQRASSVLAVEMAPDPRLELDDLVAVIRGDQRDWGLIVGLDVPLTASDGAMRVDVGVL